MISGEIVSALSKCSSYDRIVHPIVTEKSTLLKETGNKYVFEVSVDSNKGQIKKAIEEVFKVEVLSVNTLLRKGKSKQFRGILGKRKTVKRAIVTLKAGSSLDVGVGG
jgi:large subunit ribosomal protein L23